MAAKTKPIKSSELKYLGICPEDQGQIVSRCWYSHERGPVLHVVDGSDRSSEWYLYEWSEDEDDLLEPWNGNMSGACGDGVEVEVSSDE